MQKHCSPLLPAAVAEALTRESVLVLQQRVDEPLEHFVVARDLQVLVHAHARHAEPGRDLRWHTRSQELLVACLQQRLTQGLQRNKCKREMLGAPTIQNHCQCIAREPWLSKGVSTETTSNTQFSPLAEDPADSFDLRYTPNVAT